MARNPAHFGCKTFRFCRNIQIFLLNLHVFRSKYSQVRLKIIFEIGSTHHYNIVMLAIRLTRVGKKKYPTYRLIVSEKSRDPWGKFLESLGNYNPHTKEKNFNKDRILYWISKGAQPSVTVHNLLVAADVIKKEKKKGRSIKISQRRRVKLNKVKADQEAKSAAKTAAEVEVKEVVEKKGEDTASPAAQDTKKTES